MSYIQLENLATVRTGFQFRGEAPFSPDGAFSIIQLKDSKHALTLEEQDIQRVELSEAKQADCLLQGDVLLRAKGRNHYAVLVDKDLKNALASGLCLVIRCTDKQLCSSYLTWYLNQPPAQSFLNQISAGTSIPIINKKSLGSLIVPLPTLSKQAALGELYQLKLKEERLSEKVMEAKRQLLNARMLGIVKAN